MVRSFLAGILLVWLAGCAAGVDVYRQAADMQAAGNLRQAHNLAQQALAQARPGSADAVQAETLLTSLKQQITQKAVADAAAATGTDLAAADAAALKMAVSDLETALAYDDASGSVDAALKAARSEIAARRDAHNQLVADINDSFDQGDYAQVVDRVGDLRSSVERVGDDATVENDLSQRFATLINDQIANADTLAALNQPALLIKSVAESPLAIADSDGLIKNIEAAKLPLAEQRMARAVREKNFYEVFLDLKANDAIFPDNLLYQQFLTLARTHYLSQSQLWRGNGNFGRAYLEAHKIPVMIGTDPEVVDLMLPIEDEVNNGLRSNVAVFKFKSPAQDPDIGNRLASELITHLSDNLDYGYRVVDQSGNILDLEDAPDSARTDVDFFVAGTVSDLSIEEQRNDYERARRVQVAERRTESEAWKLWYREKLRRDATEMAVEEPERYVVEPVFESQIVSSGDVALFGSTRVSVQIVRRRDRAVIEAEDFHVDQEYRDQFSDPYGEVARDPIEIPTRAQIRDELSSQMVDEIANSVISTLNNRANLFLERAQRFVSRREFGRAYNALAEGVLYCQRTQLIDEQSRACSEITKLVIEQTEGSEEDPLRQS